MAKLLLSVIPFASASASETMPWATSRAPTESELADKEDNVFTVAELLALFKEQPEGNKIFTEADEEVYYPEDFMEDHDLPKGELGETEPEQLPGFDTDLGETEPEQLPGFDTDGNEIDIRVNGILIRAGDMVVREEDMIIPAYMYQPGDQIIRREKIEEEDAKNAEECGQKSDGFSMRLDIAALMACILLAGFMVVLSLAVVCIVLHYKRKAAIRDSAEYTTLLMANETR